MEIASRAQSSRRNARRFPGLAIAAALGTLIAPLAVPGSPDGRPPLDPAELAARIAALGSDRWEEREEATQAILELGPAAAPALRAAAGSPDPEVRNRLEWLLSVLVPPVFEVELVRLGGPEPPFAPLEWLRVEFPERAEGDGETRTAGDPPRRVHIAVGESRAPFRLEISIGIERGTHEFSASIDLDTLTLIEREERFATEDALGRVRVEREHAFWVARLSRREGGSAEPAAEDREAIAARLASEIRDAIAAGGARGAAAVAVAAQWRRIDLLPPLDGAPAELRREIALARLVAGDPAALIPLEEIYTASLAGTDPLEPSLEEEATLALAAAGSEAAFSRLVARFGESALWAQHRGCGILVERLAEPGFAASHGERILSGLFAPGQSAGIQWADGLLALLLQELADRLPPPVFARALGPALAETLDDAGGTMGNRVQTILRVLLRSLRECGPEEGIAVDEWFEPVRRLLHGNSLEAALSLLIDRRNSGDLDAERFAEACRTLGRNLAIDEPSLLHRSYAALKRVLDTADLAAEERRRIRLDTLLCYDLTGQNANLRIQVDRELVAAFGALSAPPPAPAEGDAPWIARRTLWRERLDDLPDEAFGLDAPADPDPLRLTISDLRIDETRGEVALLDCRSEFVIPSRPRVEIGADLEDRSLRLDAYEISGRPGMYRFTGGSVLEIGRPIARRLAPRWRRVEYIVSPGRLGFLYADRQQSVVFESLVLLESPESEGVADDLVPAPGDPPAELHRKLEGRLLAAFAQAKPQLRRDFLVVIARFRIAAAAAPLAAAYEAAPDVELARALLALGDHRGRDLLLAAAKPGERDAVEILGALLRAGDPAALEPTLAWIESPPPRAQGSIHALLQSLDLAIEDPRLAPHIDEARLLGALVAAIDQPGLGGMAIPILRRRTGLDHGYYDAFQILEQEEREAALDECHERWRAWWRERSAKRP